MLTRFAAGSFVACNATAIVSVGTLIFSGLNPQRFALILAIWCFAPCVWGLWAMLSPIVWIPRRLPVWGMILGILAGLMAVFVLNLPSRVVGAALPNSARIFSILAAALFYYLMWILVRIVYMSLSGPSSAPSRD